MTEANYREARKGRAAQVAHWAAFDALPPGAFSDQHKLSDLPPCGNRRHRGGLLASSSNSGTWADEVIYPNSVFRARERRAVEREVQADLNADEALDAREFFCGSTADAEEWASSRAEEDTDDFYIEDDYGFPVFVGPTWFDGRLA